MSYTYDQLTVSLSQYSSQQPYPYTLLTTDQLYTALPRIIESAEARIYRALTFLANRTKNTALSFTSGNRELSIASITPAIMVVEGVAILTPFGCTAANGYRRACNMTSLDTIDACWPQPSVTYDPVKSRFLWWAMKDEDTIVVCPTPNAAYKVEITGLFMPNPLSSTNTTTYLSTTYPELLFASCMIDIAGMLRDYGQQADDPKLALSWKDRYDEHLQLAMAEEQRRRGQGVGWTPNMPTPLAQPPRT